MLKKRNIWIICAIVVILADVAACSCPGTNSAQSNDYEGILRFHVIANSNSAEDQALKLRVRDHILTYINDGLAREISGKFGDTDTSCDGKDASLNIDMTRKYIKAHMSDIEAEAESVVTGAGYDYRVRGELGVCYIPQKTYGDMVFPEGNYESLNITIGEGRGENWWCVLFPPLCLIDTQGEDAAKGLGLTGDETIKLKSKVAELIEVGKGKQ